jgi:endonuclease I/V8-like Glu-specific endopeptidase
MSVISNYLRILKESEERISGYSIKVQERIKNHDTSKQTIQPRQVARMAEHSYDKTANFASDVRTLERIIDGNDMLPVWYMEVGMKTARAVCKVNVVDENDEPQGSGTGILIAPNILLTNNHVLESAAMAVRSTAEFRFEKDPSARPLESTWYELDPNELFYTNVDLDFTLVYVKNLSSDENVNLSEFGHIQLNGKVGKTREGEHVSIIQHPSGQPKTVALRNNTVTNINPDNFIHYVTDTEPGSSGSPVFSDRWEMVALHHSGVPAVDAEGNYLNLNDQRWHPSQGQHMLKYVANEGIRVSSIVRDIVTMAYPTVNRPVLLKSIVDANRDLSANQPVAVQPQPMLTGVRPSSNSPSPVPLVSVSRDYYDAAMDANAKDSYYSSVKNGNAPTFEQLNDLLERTHTKFNNYAPSRFVYPLVDVHPDGYIYSIYSGKAFKPNELILLDARADTERYLKIMELNMKEDRMMAEAYEKELESIEASLPYNCEHVVPQSWFGKQEPMRGDIHHLFACESGCNSFRSNHPYHDFPQYNPQNIPDEEKLREKCGNMENSLFEPENNHGVVARAVLYFLLRYPNNISNKYDEAGLQTLLKWHKWQQVSDYERHRNVSIAALQGNRNPLIDYPEWADSIQFKKGL